MVATPSQHAARLCGSRVDAILRGAGAGVAHRVSRRAALLLGARGVVVWLDVRDDAVGPRGVLVSPDALGDVTDGARWRYDGRALRFDDVAALSLDGAPTLDMSQCVVGGAGAAVRDDVSLVLAARAMVGLGRGLTPSGDDVLGGFLMGARAAGRRHRALARAVLRASRSTVPVSRARLRDHARGAGTVAEVRYVRAARGGAARADALAALEAFGHSSGRDFARGVDLALAPDGLARLCAEGVTL